MNIAFKSDNIFKNFCKVPHHPVLDDLICWLHENKIERIVTSAYRANKIHPADSGIHTTNPLRAIDLRSWTIRNPNIVRDKINNAWLYDPARPGKKVCVYHTTGRGYHFHLQVHDNTRLK